MKKYIIALAAIIATATAVLAQAQDGKPETKAPQPSPMKAWEEQCKAAITPAEFAAAMVARPAPWKKADLGTIRGVATIAVAAGDPEAMQWAWTAYRYAPASQLTNTVRLVAAALKNKDGNLDRANQWIAQQNTGKDKVKFTADELNPPAALAEIVPSPQEQLDRAMRLYRAAEESFALNAAIGQIANALRAIDHDVLRQNEFIKEMQAGRKFDIK